MSNGYQDASAWPPVLPWRYTQPPVPQYRAISDAWKGEVEKLTPFGRRVAREVGQPTAIPRPIVSEPRSPPWGWHDPRKPRGQKIAVFGGAPMSLRRILAHELGHAMQRRTWGSGLSYLTRPRQFYGQLTPEERLRYGRAEPGAGYAAENPWEIYAGLAERPLQIRPELRSWYPQYWSWEQPEPIVPEGRGSASGYRPPSRVPLYGTSHYLNRMVREMGWY